MARGFKTIVGMGLAFLAAACASAPPKKEIPVFFPPAPDPPRVQFLTYFSSLKDIQKQSSFNRFVVGEKQDVKLDKPYGLAIHDGKIYVCDTNATVVIFDLKTKAFSLLPGAAGPGRLMQPINISIEADGTKYVADPVRGQIVAFDAGDNFLKAYGEPGAWRPVDAVAFEDRLYVADIANAQIKVFDKGTGELVKTIGNQGEPTEKLERPSNLAFDREGYLYVTDAGRFQVVKFDRDGHFQSTIGQLGDNLGHFARPKGIALDHDGRLYAVDAAFNNVQIFNKEGRILMFFGGGGGKPGDLLLPAKVTIDYDDVQYFQPFVEPDFQIDYLVLVTSQFGPRLVNIYAFGRERGKHYPTDEELQKQIEERRKRELEPPPSP